MAVIGGSRMAGGRSIIAPAGASTDVRRGGKEQSQIRSSDAVNDFDDLDRSGRDMGRPHLHGPFFHSFTTIDSSNMN